MKRYLDLDKFKKEFDEVKAMISTNPKYFRPAFVGELMDKLWKLMEINAEEKE